MRTYHVIVHKEEEDTGYWAEVQELPGCFASGETLDDLEGDVRDAIDQHLAALREAGKTPPDAKEATDDSMRWEIAVA